MALHKSFFGSSFLPFLLHCNLVHTSQTLPYYISHTVAQGKLLYYTYIPTPLISQHYTHTPIPIISLDLSHMFLIVSFGFIHSHTLLLICFSLLFHHVLADTTHSFHSPGHGTVVSIVLAIHLILLYHSKGFSYS